jgi:hypothetical protein
MDYVHALRGMTWVQFFEFGAFREMGELVPVRDCSFIENVNAYSSRAKSVDARKKAQFRNLTPLVGEVLEEDALAAKQLFLDFRRTMWVLDRKGYAMPETDPEVDDEEGLTVVMNDGDAPVQVRRGDRRRIFSEEQVDDEDEDDEDEDDDGEEQEEEEDEEPQERQKQEAPIRAMPNPVLGQAHLRRPRSPPASPRSSQRRHRCQCPHRKRQPQTRPTTKTHPRRCMDAGCRSTTCAPSRRRRARPSSPRWPRGSRACWSKHRPRRSRSRRSISRSCQRRPPATNSARSRSR